MEKDLVEELKDSCKRLDKYLYGKYDEFVRRGIKDLADAKNEDTVGLDYLDDMVDLIEREQSIYNNVNKRNIKTKRMQYDNLVDEVNAKIKQIEEFVSAKENVIGITSGEIDDEETEEVENVHPIRKGFVIGGLVGIALGALGVYGITNMKGCTNKSNSRGIETIETTETENTSSKEVTTGTETQTTEVPTTEAKVVIPGELGTFTDIDDEQQLKDRANYIMTYYYGPYMDRLSDNEKSLITEENIINTIRVMNGKAPFDHEGNLTVNANTVADYGQMFTYLVGDLGSSPQLDGTYFNVPAAMFTVDNTDLQKFVMGYDNAYQKMTDGYNLAVQERLEGKEVTGGTLVREGIAEVGQKMWNEWQCQGMYGDVNPYNFEAKDKAYAYLSGFAKYGAYAFEYNMNAMQPVCIPACIDYSTKQMQEVNVNDIYWGIATGEWNNIIGKSVGAENKVEPDSIAFFDDLQRQVEWDYNQTKQMKLN